MELQTENFEGGPRREEESEDEADDEEIDARLGLRKSQKSFEEKRRRKEDKRIHYLPIRQHSLGGEPGRSRRRGPGHDVPPAHRRSKGTHTTLRKPHARLRAWEELEGQGGPHSSGEVHLDRNDPLPPAPCRAAG